MLARNSPLRERLPSISKAMKVDARSRSIALLSFASMAWFQAVRAL